MADRIPEERRWTTAIERSAFGVWDLDPSLEQVHYSPEWKARLGFPRIATPEPSAFWRCRVHPADVMSMLRALRLHLDGSSPTYESRFRLRTNGAGYRTMLSRGRVVARDASGQGLRMVGTMVDLAGRPVWGAKRGGLVAELDTPVDDGRRSPFHDVLASGVRLERRRMTDLVGDLLDLALSDARAAA